MKTKKLIYIGVLVAQALVLYIFESMIPMLLLLQEQS